ncbi:hypothetical protein ACS5PN_19120 [Roseateles sp. NT4]|uniref:hypothetical protein n=1 Tax=Roseateles sp. NT4 TaxID=3453715 RepID=UPI003EEE0294
MLLVMAGRLRQPSLILGKAAWRAEQMKQISAAPETSLRRRASKVLSGASLSRLHRGCLDVAALPLAVVCPAAAWPPRGGLAMTRLTQVFWVVAALDAALLVLALGMSLRGDGGRDGGREMGLFFFVLLPALLLVMAALSFHFSASRIWRGLALGVVLLPAIWWTQVQIQEWLITRRMAAKRAGTGYFDTEAMRRMGAAVVQRDVAALLHLGRGVDVNTPGHHNMSLLRLAVQGLEGDDLSVVRALLDLGARADDALPAAVMRSDPALLEMLLAAGGNPNLQVSPGLPLIFDMMSTVTPGNFRLLVAHGLDVDSVCRGDPLPVQLAIYRRWDLLLIALEGGADMARLREDGRGVAGELASQAEAERQAGRSVPAALRQALDLLAAQARQR